MILVRFSAVIKDITIEVEGEADTLTGIIEAWESFVLSTYQVEHETTPTGYKELDIHIQNFGNPVMEMN
jgi:hypothetical protein